MNEKEKLASWMVMNGFATGHGDTFDELLFELTWQIKEIRNAIVFQKQVLGVQGTPSRSLKNE